MARRTAQDFVTNIAANVGDPGYDVLAANSILRLVNDAQNEIAINYEPPELLGALTTTTTSGDSYVDFTYTAQPIKIISMLVISPLFRMIQVDEPWYRMATSGGGTAGTSGQPTHWFAAYESGLFRLWPTPDATYTIGMSYIKIPTELVLTPSPTSSEMLQPWDDVIEMMATHRAFMRLQQFPAAQAWLQQATSLAQRVARATDKPNDEPLSIGNPKAGWFSV